MVGVQVDLAASGEQLEGCLIAVLAVEPVDTMVHALALALPGLAQHHEGRFERLHH